MKLSILNENSTFMDPFLTHVVRGHGPLTRFKSFNDVYGAWQSCEVITAFAGQ